MTDSLSERQVKWLTYLVYVLLSVLTVVTGWQQMTISRMPEQYVRLERYKSDQDKLEKSLDKINQKLDLMIMGRREIEGR